MGWHTSTTVEIQSPFMRVRIEGKRKNIFFLSPRWLVFILIFDVGGSRIPGQYAEVWKKKDFYLLCVFRRLY